MYILYAEKEKRKPYIFRIAASSNIYFLFLSMNLTIFDWLLGVARFNNNTKCVQELPTIF